MLAVDLVSLVRAGVLVGLGGGGLLSAGGGGLTGAGGGGLKSTGGGLETVVTWGLLVAWDGGGGLMTDGGGYGLIRTLPGACAAIEDDVEGGGDGGAVACIETSFVSLTASQTISDISYT